MAPSTTVTMPRRSGSASASNPPSRAAASSRSTGWAPPQLFERPLCGGLELVQPRQHGVHDGGGHLRVRRREHSVTKNGLPPVLASTASTASLPSAAIPADVRRGSGIRVAAALARSPSSACRGCPGATSSRTAGEHDERMHAVQPPGELAQRVEGGVVGPVHVLDQQERRLLAREAGQQRLQQVVAGAVGERGPQRRWAVPGDVAQGAEGPRGEQVVAAAAQHDPVGRQIGRERAHQCGLPDPGLAGDERDRARTGPDPPRRPAQDVELRGAFHQRRHDLHGGTPNMTFRTMLAGSG